MTAVLAGRKRKVCKTLYCSTFSLGDVKTQRAYLTNPVSRLFPWTILVGFRMAQRGSVPLHIKEGFIIRRVGDSFVAVATGDAVGSFNGMIKLNETAALVWEDLQKGLPLDEIVAHLCDEYDVDACRARADVLALCGDLLDAGVAE